VDSNHRPPGPEPGALARLSHAPNSIAGNPGAGGSKARQRASAPAINCEFSITLGSGCRIGRGLDKFTHTGFLWVPGIWVDPIVGCSKNGTRYYRWRRWDQRSVFAQCDKTARVSLSVTQRSSWTANAVNTPPVREAGFTADEQVGIPGRVTFRLVGLARQDRAVGPSAGLIRDFDVRFLRSLRCRMPKSPDGPSLRTCCKDVGRRRDNLLFDQRGL
jgi:hypothetical protein